MVESNHMCNQRRSLVIFVENESKVAERKVVSKSNVLFCCVLQMTTVYRDSNGKTVLIYFFVVDTLLMEKLVGSYISRMLAPDTMQLFFNEKENLVLKEPPVIQPAMQCPVRRSIKIGRCVMMVVAKQLKYTIAFTIFP